MLSLIKRQHEQPTAITALLDSSYGYVTVIRPVERHFAHILQHSSSQAINRRKK